MVGCEKCSQKVLNSINSRRFFMNTSTFYEHFLHPRLTRSATASYLFSIIVVPFYCGWSLLVGRAFTQRKGDSELVAQFD